MFCLFYILHNSLQKHLKACFSTFSFRFSSGYPFVGFPYWCHLWKVYWSHLLNEIMREISFGITVVRKKWILFWLYIFLPKLLCFLVIDVTFGTLEPSKWVWHLTRDYRTQYKWKKIGEIVKISYSQIPMKRHKTYGPYKFVNSNSVLHIMSIYRLEIAVNKEWILWIHLISNASKATKVLFSERFPYLQETHFKFFS